MIQVVLFLITVALVAAGFVWLADRPGDVLITWMGYRIETSFMVALLAVGALVVVAMIVWSVARGILRSPDQVSLFFRHRRAMKGHLAITRGLVAIGAGDLRLARKSADEAARLSPGDPLMLLLTAQSAQMAGDRGGAERAFHEMTRHENTRLLGLRGLYIEAQRRNDFAAARRVAEEAAKAAPALAWAGQAVLDDRCAAADWLGALEALDHMGGALDKNDYRRKRAVLLTARALALDDRDRDASRALALDAVKLAPDLAPAAALAGRRLAEAGDARRASKILNTAWKLNPHPDIADAYANLRFGDTARARLTRMQSLAEKAPGQLEGAIAVARAALDAREFAVARAALAPYLSAPTKRVATLMAEIEETEHGDEGRVREWMGRAMRAAGDPVWTADGVVSDRWLPVSPNGRLDGYEWRMPLAELGGTAHPVIDAAPPPLPEPKPEPKPEPQPVLEKPEPAAPTAEVVPLRKAQRPAARPAQVEAVIPLVHAPDDPGPESGLDVDPMPETTQTSVAGPWERLKQMFR
ncbi:MAG: heme biosynthesis HemY N-terminal domain-containing protein [Pseudolabrys sp.]|nr:heme biosynthesis HemY N-terminal domain-containing protein [Pseudolabrys sp.]MDP2296366.1 heme biosynthesis HemY N-terminal domain-containing protein [Pseudolabrys sp.]